MRHVHINSYSYGSTGAIMLRGHRTLLDSGEESYAFWGRGRSPRDGTECRFATDAEVYVDVLQTRLDDRAGFHSKRATGRFLRRLDELQPDVVHLHNLHGYYLNVEMLFGWLARSGCRIEWTLHDCWAFTGHCAYFTYAKCAQWMSHCAYSESCPQLCSYPKTLFKGACAKNFEDKRRLFTSVPANRMTLVSPSEWLARLVKESFLSAYPVEVHHNEVDRNIFKPTPGDFRARHGIGERFMVLGVASPWTERKGLGDFLKLVEELDPARFVIVLVGLSKRQLKALPSNIIGLERTSSPCELAEIYTAADVLFNPTVEDNFPTVNLEAEACGTPVITYDTGGCRETIQREDSLVIPAGDIDAASFDLINRAMPSLQRP